MSLSATSEICIRPAILSDLPAITAIYAHAVRTGTATFELDPPDLTEMEARFTELTAAGFPYLVAITDHGFAGYAYAAPYRPRPAYRFAVENSVYVSTQMQRRGVGSRLLDALIDDATARDFRQMIAVIGDSENAASVSLHTRAGFRMVGTHPDVGFKFGRWLDTVLMQRALRRSDNR